MAWVNLQGGVYTVSRSRVGNIKAQINIRLLKRLWVCFHSYPRIFHRVIHDVSEVVHKLSTGSI